MASGKRKKNESFKKYRKRLNREEAETNEYLEGIKVFSGGAFVRPENRQKVLNRQMGKR